MNTTMSRSSRALIKGLVATFAVVLAISVGTTNANAFAGTLENGNMAYAQSAFNTGEACIYLPGFTSGYDAWHFVLTTRGATFQQDPKNPAVSINLNFVFMRQDGTLFTIKSGAWVQTGKGAYVYTPVADKIRMVQAGTLAQINGSDSGMRLSHTCPGTGSVVRPTVSPTPTPSPSVTPTPTPTPTSKVTPTPTPSPSSTIIPTLRPRPSPTSSAIQLHPKGPRSPLPTPSATPQGITETPTPSPTPKATKSSTPTPTASPTASPTPTEPNNPVPPTVPTPPVVEDPKNVEYVEPKTPANIDPKNFPEPPSSAPVVITQKPVYGEVKANNDRTFTYSPPAVIPALPVVDVVEFKYTNLAGQAVTVRKEFVLTVKGDVPSIIQTGGNTAPSSNNFGLIAFALTAGLIFVRRLIATKRGHTHA